MRFLINFLLIVVIDILFLSSCYYGMNKEIGRSEAENTYCIQKCEADPNYYPDFCKHLLGE